MTNQVIEQQAATLPVAANSSAIARRAMIDSQLRVSGVNDPAILAAMGAVPREDYVPADRRAVAYADRAIPLGDGRVLAPALTHGQMLTEAQLSADDTVLVISANGYLAALAGLIAGSVTCRESLKAAGGSPKARGSYSVILIDGAAEVLPAGINALLADDGLVVTGLIENGVTRLATGRKAAGTIALFTLSEADFAPLTEFAAPRKWSF